jgi:hypothetical protein
MNDIDPAIKILAAIFAIGMLLTALAPKPSSDGPSELKCWGSDVGYETC